MTEAEKRELLGMAAKAAGVRYDPELSKPHPTSGAFWGLWLLYDREPTEHDRRHWNPLEDDGDALRLAVKLGLSFAHYPIYEQPKHAVIVYRRTLGDDGESHVTEAEALERYCGDPCAATRLAITRAAAEIGRQMQSAEGAREV